MRTSLLKTVFIILSVIFLCGCNIDSNLPLEKEEVEMVTPIVEEIEMSFPYEIVNNANAPQEVIDLLVKYNNEYFKMMKTLEYESFDSLFIDNTNFAINDYSTKLLIETRKQYGLNIDSGSFNLDITYYSEEDDTCYVEFIENENLHFEALDEIESGIYNVSGYAYIKKDNNVLKFEEFDKIQDYFVMFTEKNYKDRDDVLSIFNNYYVDLLTEVSLDKKLKQEALANPYENKKEVEHPYDRLKAQEYLYEHYLIRNDNYMDYGKLGGNCQNYASQTILAGGIPMDIYGNRWQQWKYYGPEVYIDETRDGRSLSWTTVDYFYEYCIENEGDPGMVVDLDCNIYYAEPGDVIHVGFDSETRHATVVSDVYNGIILLNSNTVDLLNFPLGGYAYNTKQLIKILGYND